MYCIFLNFVRLQSSDLRAQKAGVDRPRAVALELPSVQLNVDHIPDAEFLNHGLADHRDAPVSRSLVPVVERDHVLAVDLHPDLNLVPLLGHGVELEEVMSRGGTDEPSSIKKRKDV